MWLIVRMLKGIPPPILMPIRKHRAKDWARQQAKRLEARIAIGKADKRWREMNGISQQNIHNLCSAAGVNFFNSQLAYWENGKLTPKTDFWYGREYINFAIAENDFPPTQDDFNRSVLDRFKNADPFLTYEGEVATAADFFQMYGGTQPINDLYTRSEELTEEFLNTFAQQLEKSFNEVADYVMVNNRKCWEMLLETKGMKAIKEQKVERLAQDLLRGKRAPTVEEAKFVMGKYKQCPCVVALREIREGSLSKKMEEEHAKLVAMTT